MLYKFDINLYYFILEEKQDSVKYQVLIKYNKLFKIIFIIKLTFRIYITL